MSFNVKVIPMKTEYKVEVGQDLLSAALKANLNLPHGCKNGTCGACKCKIVSGDFALGKYHPQALTNQEREREIVLSCRAFAKSDLIIEVPEFSGGHAIKTLPIKIKQIEKIGTVAIVKLRLPYGYTLEYDPGQYIDIMFEMSKTRMFEGGKTRSYSIANWPISDGMIELHIRYRKNGLFSEALWNKFRAGFFGKILLFKGPLGGFKLQESNKSILMVCTGTGFAPIKAILEYMRARGISRKISLVWGNYSAADFYKLDTLEMLRQQLNINLTLCVKNGQVAGFKNCLVTDVVREDFTNLDDYEVYACGNLTMIQDLYDLTTSKLNLLPMNFFSDAFTQSS